MDMMIIVSLMLLFGIAAGATSIIRKQDWKKTLVVTGAGFGFGYIVGYFLAPFILSFY